MSGLGEKTVVDCSHPALPGVQSWGCKEIAVMPLEAGS
jgi:hypothetical protein